MSLYPEGSTGEPPILSSYPLIIFYSTLIPLFLQKDGGIRLGNIVPDFAMDTTHGKFDSFHEWKKGQWAILFSHPADFTPGKIL